MTHLLRWFAAKYGESSIYDNPTARGAVLLAFSEGMAYEQDRGHHCRTCTCPAPKPGKGGE